VSRVHAEGTVLDESTPPDGTACTPGSNPDLAGALAAVRRGRLRNLRPRRGPRGQPTRLPLRQPQPRDSRRAPSPRVNLESAPRFGSTPSIRPPAAKHQTRRAKRAIVGSGLSGRGGTAWAVLSWWHWMIILAAFVLILRGERGCLTAPRGRSDRCASSSPRSRPCTTTTKEQDGTQRDGRDRSGRDTDVAAHHRADAAPLAAADRGLRARPGGGTEVLIV